MSTSTPRPIGVILVAILLFLTGAYGLFSGISGLIAAAALGSAADESTQAGATIVGVVSGVVLLTSVLNIIFAVGILRGSRVARMIVTVLQAITIVGGIVGIVTASTHLLNGLLNLIVPVLIVVLLWAGARTKAFFAKR